MKSEIHVHFMGISGSGCSAAAAIAEAQGFAVSGCDINLDQENLVQMMRTKLLFRGHNPDHLKGIDLLVISPAVNILDSHNLELQEAQVRKISVLTWQEFVGRFLLDGKFVIAVCGTHGKSTTSGMLGFVLEQAGLNPSVLLGARILNWNRNFRVGASQYFVIEADEYNNNFFSYHPNVVIITNIELDHPDFFKDEKKLYSSFAEFLLKSRRPLALFVQSESIGISEFLRFLADSNKTRQLLKFVNYVQIRQLKLHIPGTFNLFNANLVYEVAKSLRLKDKIVRQALANFRGLSRRFELAGYVDGMKVFDDYAHHPQEVRETLQMARAIFPGKNIWVFFQPHTFSRTSAFFSDFVKVFKESPVEQIFLLDIFAAREKEIETVSSKKMADAAGLPKIQYIGNISDAAAFLNNIKDKPDVLINMGAGDIVKLSKILLGR